MKPLTIGIIGCGYIAQKTYLPILTAMKNVRITGVLSKSTQNWEKISSSWPQIKTMLSWDDFLGSGLKAVFVLTPAETHYDMCDKLLAEGIHVFVEKPATTSVGETLQIAQKAQEKKLIFMVGFNRRFSTPVMKAKSQFKPDQIRLCILEKYRPIRQERDLAETYREDLIHQIDLIRMLCGEMKAISTISTHREGNLLSSVSNLKNNTGGLGVILHSRESGLWQERITIVGENKTLLVNMFQSVIETSAAGDKTIWETQSRQPLLDDRGFREEINHFLTCINTKTNPLTNGFEAAKSQQLQEQLVALDKPQRRS